jgi:hypothetical protein
MQLRDVFVLWVALAIGLGSCEIGSGLKNVAAAIRSCR